MSEINYVTAFIQYPIIGLAILATWYFYPDVRKRDAEAKLEEKEDKKEMRDIIREQVLVISNNTTAFNTCTAVLARVIDMLEKQNPKI